MNFLSKLEVLQDLLGPLFFFFPPGRAPSWSLFPQRDSDDAESSAGLLVGMTVARRLHLGGPMAASSVRQLHPATTLDRKAALLQKAFGT